MRWRLTICLCMLLAAPAAATENVDLELVLAADGSGSIDDAEFELQRRGYAAAITHPKVIASITGGIHQAIAITYVEWAAPDSVATVVGWHMIHDAKSAKIFADKLVKAPRMVDGNNSISAAILYGVNEIEKNAYSSIRKIIDISGDSPQINGPPLPFARNYALAKGITINAIAIDTPYDPRTGPNGEPLRRALQKRRHRRPKPLRTARQGPQGSGAGDLAEINIGDCRPPSRAPRGLKSVTKL